MVSRLRSVTFDADDPARLAAFWAGVLGRTALDAAGGVLLPGSATQVGLRFVAGAAGRVAPNRMHLHLTSTSSVDQQDVVARCLDLGARHLDVGQRPEEGHVVLGDPEGNELCVIPPESSFLAGCGLLGEVGCEGSREAGLFWAVALGWPLVWDEDGETAIQAPDGGTKVAWGGPPLPDRRGPDRQRLDLVVPDGDRAPEVERLVGLGATRLPDEGDVVVLADPDGTAFELHRG